MCRANQLNWGILATSRACGFSISVECVELTRLGLEGSKLVMQLKSRPKSVGCGGGELHKSSTLLKPTEKWENLGIVRLSKLFLLVVVFLEVEFVNTSDVVQFGVIVVGSSVIPSWISDTGDNLIALSMGNILHILTSDLDICSSWWTSDLGIIGVSLLHVDICWCLMLNIGDWTSVADCSSPC